MTLSEVKQILIQTRIAQQEYSLAVSKARQYDEMISAAKVSEFEPRAADDTGRNTQEEKLIIALSYHERVRELEKAMTETRRKTDMLIDSLDMQSEKEIITRRYLICQTWEQIAEGMGYSLMQIFRIHNKALEKMLLNVTL